MAVLVFFSRFKVAGRGWSPATERGREVHDAPVHRDLRGACLCGVWCVCCYWAMGVSGEHVVWVVRSLVALYRGD